MGIVALLKASSRVSKTVCEFSTIHTIRIISTKRLKEILYEKSGKYSTA